MVERVMIPTIMAIATAMTIATNAKPTTITKATAAMTHAHGSGT